MRSAVAAASRRRASGLRWARSRDRRRPAGTTSGASRAPAPSGRCHRPAAAGSTDPPPSAARPDLRQGRELALAFDEEMREPVADDLQILDPAERRTRSGELVGFLGHPQEADRATPRAEHREELFGLADRRPDVLLAVLDEERRPDRVGVRDRRDLPEVRRVLPRLGPELVAGPEAAADVA